MSKPRDPLLLVKILRFLKYVLVKQTLKYSLMIRLQVPLQQPCYDFSFLQTLGFAELPRGLTAAGPNNSPKHPSR